MSYGNKGHLQYRKNERGEFVCPTCGVTMNRQNSMHYHLKTHQADAMYPCAYCTKSFVQRRSLDLHIRSKHANENRSFLCPYDGCPFESHTKGNCVIHCLRVHFHDEIAPYLETAATPSSSSSYGCRRCHRHFPSTSAFYYHVKGCLPFDKTTAKYRRIQHLL